MHPPSNSPIIKNNNSLITHFHSFVFIYIVSGCYIYIFADDIEGFTITLRTVGDTLSHFFGLLIQTIFSQSSCGDSHKIKNITVFTNKSTVGLGWFTRLDCMKTATVSNILAEMEPLFAARIINRMAELGMESLN